MRQWTKSPTRNWQATGSTDGATNLAWPPPARSRLLPYNARHDRAGIRFNLINPETGNRIRMITQDAETGKEVERRDLVKGYEFRKNQYVLLNDEDFDKADLEDRYETRMRAMIDAKLKGEGIDASEPEAPERTNVVDLMAALKKSLGEEPAKKPAPAKKKAAAAKVTSIKPPQAASAKRKRA